MGDTASVPSSSKSIEVAGATNGSKSMHGRRLVASAPKSLKKRTVKHMNSLDLCRLGHEYTGHVTFFLLKVAALEIMRRCSMAKFPFAWRGLQALQVFCFPPFKWLQRWAPFKILVRSMQKISTPLSFLSVVTAFSDQTKTCKDAPAPITDSQPGSGQDSEQTVRQPAQDTRIGNESLQNVVSENWVDRLHMELEKQNITLPVRINEDELQRFFDAANGNFSSLLSSLKKTIRWRETYHILSSQELEMWSNLVFWHGYDKKLRPCLVIRLGLACSSLASHEKPCFAQAIVSQVEHGVLHLLNAEDLQITVLMDCDGLPPAKFPMQMMRSFSVLMQDHYPNRLGCLFIVRLPSVVRVIMQTFIQVLKPVTREKLRIEGKMFEKVLSENLQMVPSFLGGKCSCPKCSNPPMTNTRNRNKRDANMLGPKLNISNEENSSLAEVFCQNNLDTDNSGQQILRTAVIAMLMVFLLISFFSMIYGGENPLQ
ncbi:hypothetical protein Sjap_012772 [Stephania japonica]|uniref:CRAL-TRIO domain-containing protein n=1 Tax=Stephania japonica TaxID=461633 RepID=A0AAP0IXF3_9MAGN